ncbi:DUF551 domain-containing protein [Enterobacter ludwigii]|uniref:DUF551 domain-containing protein n=1 Tax=Enterobacter ludwigii TaxID=299767 RepID=UPI002A807AAE|nr:DUF551 domain-containing protein [Enterobacter ludwigii]
MSTITKQAVQAVADLKAGYTLGHADVAILNELARIALASLEAEAVAYADPQAFRNFQAGAARREWMWRNPGEDLIPLFIAPPATVSAPEWTNKQCLEFLSIAFRHAEINGDLQFDDIRLGVKMVNGSRATMLQGAESAESRCSIQTAPVLDSLPKIAESRCSNSPVIPDGWVACSERMPEEGSKVIVFRPSAEESNDPPVKTATYKGGREYYHGFDCYCEPTHWMPLPAAPQQEVK